MHRSPILSTVPVLVLLASAPLHAQQNGFSFIEMPYSNQELRLLFQEVRHYETRVDLRVTTQGAEWDVNRNPYKYTQEFRIRPWLIYHRSEHLQWAFSTSYIRKLQIPAVGQKRSNEIRAIAMGTRTQARSWGEMYGQGRFELRNIKTEGANDWQNIPRVRFRFGQTFDLGESRWKPSIPVYQEIIFKYEEGEKALDTVLFYGGYGFAPAAGWSATAGVRVEYELKSGNVFNVFFGPYFTVTYHVGRPSGRRPPPPDSD